MSEKIKFTKMNGAGNDFIIFDARNQEINLSKEKIKQLSSRDNIGCDQLIIVRNSSDADCLMEIYNSDGSLSGACGNATRCVASLIEKPIVKIKTAAGILTCEKKNNLIAVNMGKPTFLLKDISLFGFDFFCVDVGNPHAVAFISNDLSDEKFFDVGSKIENHEHFPKKTNVEFAKIISDKLIEVRVWERGAGETLACGSGACAVGILAIKNKLVIGSEVTIRFKGGDLLINWAEGGFVVMTGGYEKEFEGSISL